MIDFISLYLHIVNIIRYHYFTIKYVESTSIKLKKFDKKMALYQGIERKYFNSTVKLPDLMRFKSLFSEVDDVLITLANELHVQQKKD